MFFEIVAFLAGGLNSADVEIYSPNGSCSHSLALLPEETTSPCFAYINQEIFYCPSQNSLQCYIYDVESNSWNAYTSMNHLHTKTTSNQFQIPSLLRLRAMYKMWTYNTFTSSFLLSLSFRSFFPFLIIFSSSSFFKHC